MPFDVGGRVGLRIAQVLRLLLAFGLARRGTLKPGQTVIEATSGNTGIALAMVCAVKGYPFVAIMSDSFSVERRKLMRILGAKVILVPAAERGSGIVLTSGKGSGSVRWTTSPAISTAAIPTSPQRIIALAPKRRRAGASS